MAPSFDLVGPPEIYLPTTSATQETQPQKPSTTGDPFIDLMVANYNHTRLDERPPMGLTENCSPTFLSTGNPCLDFFFHIVPDTPAGVLAQRLQVAWAHNPLTTLKLVCNLRGVRGTGKSDKEGFYTAAMWLHKHHPKTLACNLASFAEFGYYKDLLEVLYRLLEGPDVRKIAKRERLKKARNRGIPMFPRRRGFKPKNRKRLRTKKKIPASTRSKIPREERVLKAMERLKIEKETARKFRIERRTAMAKKAIERYRRDPDYRFLYDQVSDLFADHLKSDLQHLNSGEVRKISLAAKWCPSIDSSYDRSTLLCESIAKRLFPRESFEEYRGIEEAHYAYRVRDRMRKQFLVPLRKALELPEVYIGANQWNSIPYNRVASVAMKTYKELFNKHDGERFQNYLEQVKAGKAKIAAGALLPHEVIASLNDEDGGQVAELQWRRIVEDLSKKGKLTNCISVCDVSGSMSGIPMEVCIALGLLVSEVSEEPWKGKVITFNEAPQLHVIKGDDLRSKTEFVRQMQWGMNTDFQRVFDLILEVAVQGGLSEDKMIKRIFVFSDMEFDQASANSWETDYEAIKRKYRESGYGNAVPEIVFWNLRDSRATPVPAKEKGVALVSGFSKNLLTLFLEGGGIIDPEAVYESAISGEEYQKLVVVD